MLEDAPGDPEEEITDTPATLEFIASTILALFFSSPPAVTTTSSRTCPSLKISMKLDLLSRLIIAVSNPV